MRHKTSNTSFGPSLRFLSDPTFDLYHLLSFHHLFIEPNCLLGCQPSPVILSQLTHFKIEEYIINNPTTISWGFAFLTSQNQPQQPRWRSVASNDRNEN